MRPEQGESSRLNMTTRLDVDTGEMERVTKKESRVQRKRRSRERGKMQGQERIRRGN